MKVSILPPCIVPPPRQAGSHLGIMGSIGLPPFQADPNRLRALLIGGGVGMPPMLFLAATLLLIKHN